MSQFKKPTGIHGRLLAKCMAFAHKDFYRNTAKALDLKADDKFLEIGFGSGIFIKKFASHVSQVSGIDYSTDMVKLARHINKKLVASGVADFRQGTASELPWSDHQFTAVAAIETFFFWPEPEKALKEIYRVLMPSGRLVIEMSFNSDDQLEHAKHVRNMKMRLYSGDEMRELLGQAGFETIAVHYYKGWWLPFKGYVVPKGMIVSGVKA